MDTIGQSKLWAFFDDRPRIQESDNTAIRKGAGHRVRSYLELATKTAELQFMNRQHVLLYRGQGKDHRNKQKNTSLKPSIFRPVKGANPDMALLEERFERLSRAESSLATEYRAQGFLGVERLTRQRIVRWSILQHYEICYTPLLDVTHSLRIAASFASAGATDDVYLFVLGVPNISGAITASAESELQVVRLSSVCPPSAVRPHIQEGYLLGEYPDMGDIRQKALFDHYEVDFGRRLVAKFIFNPKEFWKGKVFPQIGSRALYPEPRNDPLAKLAETVKAAVAAGDPPIQSSLA
jgi:hypothetical protein